MHANPTGNLDRVRLVYVDHPASILEAQIRNITQDAIRVRVPAEMLPGSAVLVEFSPGCSERGTVMYCRRDGLVFCADVDFQKAGTRDDRRETRVNRNQPAVVSEVRGTGDAIHGKLVDASPSGAGLLLADPVRVQSLVRVELPDAVLFGEVRYCRLEDHGYRVGLAVEHAQSRGQKPTGFLNAVKALWRRAS